MEEADVSGTKQYADLFRQSVLEDVPYWQAYLRENQADPAALKRKQDQIIKNIQLALELEAGRQPAQPLIEAFSPYMERWGYWSRWRETLDRALQAARDHQDEAGAVRLAVLLARLAQRQGNPGDTIRYYRRAIRLAKEANDVETKARACSNLGFLYIERGHWYRAEVLCCHALRLFEQMDHNHGRAHTENHLGFLYIRQEKWDRAEHHLSQACTLWESMGDRYGLVYGLANFGLLYLEREMPDQALPYIQQALDHAKYSGDEISVGLQLMHIGSAYYLKSEWSKAETYLRQAEKIFSRSAHIFRLGQVYAHLGLTKIKQQAWDEAKVFLYKALEAGRKLGYKNREARVLTDLAEYELAVDNHHKAKLFLEEAEALAQQFDQIKQYRSLWRRIDKLRRSLSNFGSEAATQQ